MIQIEPTIGTTIGIKSDSNKIVSVNLLDGFDIIYLLKEAAKKYPKIKPEIDELAKKLANKQFTLCFKSHIGKEIFFANNIFEEKYKC